MSDPEHASLSGLKMIALAGPITVAMGGVGSAILALALRTIDNPEAKEHLVILGGMLVVLAFVEWIMARRFHIHEGIERRDRADLAKSIAIDGQRYLDRAMNQIESVGARYDQVHEELKELIKIAGERGPQIKLLENQVQRLEKDVTDLKDWRSKIGSRLGELR